MYLIARYDKTYHEPYLSSNKFNDINDNGKMYLIKKRIEVIQSVGVTL